MLRLCVDTGHCMYAGFDPLDFMRRHASRVAYVHFKSTAPGVKAHAIANRTGFYEACAHGVFCHLSDGEIDFAAVRSLLDEIGYEGWCTVEQDCDPTGPGSPVADARKNRDHLTGIGFQ